MPDRASRKPFRSIGHAAMSGAIGYAVVESLRAATRNGRLRRGAVTVTAWALQGGRAAEAGAEAARLSGSDIVAEARQKIGQPAPVPGRPGTEPHDHEH